MTILPSMCDRSSKLRINAALDIFQDTATIHADMTGIGPLDMERLHSYWVITKTRIHIYRMPQIMEKVLSTTWMQPNGAVRCERDYSITKDGELLVYGKSEWAVMSKETGKPVMLSEIYPDVVYELPSPDDRPYLRMRKAAEEAANNAVDIGTYIVRSVDIDLGGHMNNVNYFRAMMGQFSCEEIEAMGIEEAELHFISQTFEGETLTFKRSDTEYGCNIAAVNEAGKTVFIAALYLSK